MTWATTCRRIPTSYAHLDGGIVTAKSPNYGGNLVPAEIKSAIESPFDLPFRFTSAMRASPPLLSVVPPHASQHGTSHDDRGARAGDAKDGGLYFDTFILTFTYSLLCVEWCLYPIQHIYPGSDRRSSVIYFSY